MLVYTYVKQLDETAHTLKITFSMFKVVDSNFVILYPYYLNHLLARQAPPRMPVEVRRAPRGSSVQLECQTDLEEPVSYKWSKQGGVIPRNVDVTAVNFKTQPQNNHFHKICFRKQYN